MKTLECLVSSVLLTGGTVLDSFSNRCNKLGNTKDCSRKFRLLRCLDVDSENSASEEEVCTNRRICYKSKRKSAGNRNKPIVGLKTELEDLTEE